MQAHDSHVCMHGHAPKAGLAHPRSACSTGTPLWLHIGVHCLQAALHGHAHTSGTIRAPSLVESLACMPPPPPTLRAGCIRTSCPLTCLQRHVPAAPSRPLSTPTAYRLHLPTAVGCAMQGASCHPLTCCFPAGPEQRPARRPPLGAGAPKMGWSASLRRSTRPAPATCSPSCHPRSPRKPPYSSPPTPPSARPARRRRSRHEAKSFRPPSPPNNIKA